MAITAGRYALRNIMNTRIFDYKTGDIITRIDYGTTSQNDWKANSTQVRGGNGAPVHIVFNDSKDSTLKISTEIFTMAQLAMLAGTSVVKGAKTLYYSEVLTVQEDDTATPAVQYVTLTKTPVSITGAASVTASDLQVVEYVNGTQGDTVTVSSVDATSKKVVLTGATNGNEVEVYYQWTTDSSALNITFDAKQFPPYVKIVGDSLFADDVAGDMVGGQVVFYKAKVQPNFTLNYNATGNATQLDMTFDILSADIGGKSIMSDLTLYDDPDLDTETA